MSSTKMGPSQRFHDAAAYLSSASSLSKVSNTTKLELYGLFKYVTVSQNPNNSRPSIFDMTGRAKWDAWASAGKTYSNVSEAEERYLQLARDLGWEERSHPTADGTVDTSVSASNQKEGEESIWDDDTVSKKRDGGGLGNKVSTVAMEDEGERKEGTLHSLVLSGNRRQVEELFDFNAEIDVNQLDDNGYTPLHLAADRGYVEIVQLLLSKGANADLKDEDEYTAHDLAEIAGHEEIVALLKGI